MSTGSSTAQVIPLAAADGAQRRVIGSAVRAITRPVAVVWPRPTVDEWGRDARLVDALAPVAHLRWDVTVGGELHLPAGAALVVVNARRMALTEVYASWALSHALERPVRFVGRPDTVPFGPLLRRAGALLAHPDEIAGALRAGELVVIAAAATRNPRQAGTIDPALIEPALREHAPVHIAATSSSLISRQARVEVAALVVRRPRRGPLAEVELAEHAQRQLQHLLDEIGDTRTGFGLLGWRPGS